MHKVILCDLSWMLYRFRHSYSWASVEISGETIPTGTLYGASQFVQSMDRAHPTAQIIFCQDGTPEEREAIHEGYKASRKLEPGADEARDIVYQHQLILPKILCIYPQVSFAFVEDKEADDIIASLFFDEKDKGNEVFIHSTDNDFLQLIRYGAQIFDRFSNGRMQFKGEEYTFKKFGVSTELLLYFRCLAGDTSDNIPPVVPRLDRNFIKFFITEWHKNGLESAFTLSDTIYPQHTSKVWKNRSALKRNVELTSLVKYRKPDSRIGVKTYKAIPDLNLLETYRLSAFRKYLETHKPELLI